MRNPKSNLPWRFLIIKSSLLLLLLFSPSISSFQTNSNQNHSPLQWQILTNQNFSTQIHLHQHILLLITVPWSGESRSIMKKLADEIPYDSVKLMVLYKDKEKMLAEALGVSTEETTIFLYRNAVNYKYQGILRTENILSSVDYFVSAKSENVPLMLLKSEEDVERFLESTDKAVLLLEFCGWSRELLSRERNNGSEYDFRIEGFVDNEVISGANLNEETNLTLTSSRDKYRKVAMRINSHHYETDFGAEIERDASAGGISWVGGFTAENDSASSEPQSTLPGVGISCAYDEFQQFESFFSNFTTFARESFLPPERQRFGMISDRHLLLSLGVGDPDSWLVMVHFAGCSNCSKILQKGDDLRTAFDMHQLPVNELRSEGHGIGSGLPGNKPSAILFVDRSSKSLKTRIHSKTVLDTFRKLALHNQLFPQMDVPDSMTQRKMLDPSFRGLKGGNSLGSSMYSSRDPSLLSTADNLKNKMSVMVINEDGNIAMDGNTEGLSIQDILNRLVKQKKEAKLSYVAKEVGFQLLSEDFEVKLAELLQPHTETTTFSKVLSEDSTGNNVENGLNSEMENNVAGFDPPQLKEEKITITVKDIPETSTQLDKWEEAEQPSQPSQAEDMRFYFSDGNAHLLKSLTSRSEFPSLIIIDPISQKHYIYPQEETFSYFSLQAFLDAFLNGSLIPFQRSEPFIRTPREATRPPFVNLDFHEMDSIPRVTVDTFSELVLGLNQSGNENTALSWKKNVLVLFSNSWCGFCQRMELVVHEVFQSLKEHFEPPGLPLIYLMDCTLNDCSLLLKSTVQRDVYPSLLLFPAQRKTAISYQGVVSVNNVIKFLVDQGSNSDNLKDVSVEAERNEALANEMPAQLDTPNDMNGATPNVDVGSVLIATDKLLNASPFDKSKILIVGANRSLGFQGIILNKRINWELFEEITKNITNVKQAPLSFGGPLIANGMPLVSLTRREIPNQLWSEVFPNVYFLDQPATVKEIEGFEVGDKSIDNYWFFLGYASWGWEQLFDEIAEGAWQISDDPSTELNWPTS